jgi:hypothetical protein
LALSYVVIDSEATVRWAFEHSLPLEELLQFACVNCKEAVFLTQKQFDAFDRDSSVQKPLYFACRRCEELKQKMKQAETGS